MAEGILRHLLPSDLGKSITVASAGTHALHGNRAEPFAVRAAAKFGADISGHRAKLLGPHLVNDADLIITMEKMHARQVNRFRSGGSPKPIILGAFDKGRKDPEIEDPYGRAYEAYEECARTLINCMEGVLDFIQNSDDPYKK